jgi:hypothetical protein
MKGMTPETAAEGLTAMATTKLLFDTARFTVIRRNDVIEIAPKCDPKGTRVFHKHAKRYESELAAAHHREGFDGVDRLCAKLLAGSATGA